MNHCESPTPNILRPFLITHGVNGVYGSANLIYLPLMLTSLFTRELAQNCAFSLELAPTRSTIGVGTSVAQTHFAQSLRFNLWM
jgi:hypothetical protein